MYDIAEQVLWEFWGVESGEGLVRRMDGDLEALKREMRQLVPDEEGEKCVERILARDETVIPVLAANFLDYTPEATHEWEENPTVSEELDEDEEIEALETLVKDMEEKLGPALDEAERMEMKDELIGIAARVDRDKKVTS